MNKWITRLTAIILLSIFCQLANAQKDIYEIRVYSLKSEAQITATDFFLKDSYLPAMHRMGIKNIGVFKPLSNDTSLVKQIWVIVPYGSLEIWYRSKSALLKDAVYEESAKSFLDADTAHLPFIRVASTLLEAFPDQTKLIPTALKSNPDAIYELRSYESPTKELHLVKVDMFNAGGEVALFKRLDFQAVFYADVLSGNRMPNLMYMVVFSSLAAREEHWKAFGASPEWKKISNDPKYRNNISVNHIDSYLMHSTAYSDL
jgi:hypothetical protein